MKEYNEQVVETLDDAGCIIANKNIIIDNLQARIAELEGDVAIERASRKYWEDAYSEWINTDKAAQGLIAKDERIAELEEENARLKAECDDIKQVQFPRKLEAVAVGWKKRLAAEQEEIKTVTEQKNRMWFEMQSAQNQLVTAEQRVAESCAKWIDGYAGIHQKEMLSDTAKSFADALRRGEWRKFVKEV